MDRCTVYSPPLLSPWHFPDTLVTEKEPVATESGTSQALLPLEGSNFQPTTSEVTNEEDIVELLSDMEALEFAEFNPLIQPQGMWELPFFELLIV